MSRNPFDYFLREIKLNQKQELEYLVEVMKYILNIMEKRVASMNNEQNLQIRQRPEELSNSNKSPLSQRMKAGDQKIQDPFNPYNIQIERRLDITHGRASQQPKKKEKRKYIKRKTPYEQDESGECILIQAEQEQNNSLMTLSTKASKADASSLKISRPSSRKPVRQEKEDSE